jgi:hypothetical protein
VLVDRAADGDGLTVAAQHVAVPAGA